MSSENVVILNKDNFVEEVKQSDVPVLVDFWASWCGPCRMLAPVIDQLADEYKDRAKIAKVNVDEERELAAQFKVTSIPTLFLFKDGEVVEQIVGARPKGELESIIDSVL